MGNTPKNQDDLPKARIKLGGCLDKPGAWTRGGGAGGNSAELGMEQNPNFTKAHEF